MDPTIKLGLNTSSGKIKILSKNVGFFRFFEEYAKLDINFWGVTVQNEAVSGVTSPWAAMYMSAEMHR
jgi:hypothetical protein